MAGSARPGNRSSTAISGSVSSCTRGGTTSCGTRSVVTAAMRSTTASTPSLAVRSPRWSFADRPPPLLVSALPFWLTTEASPLFGDRNNSHLASSTSGAILAKSPGVTDEETLTAPVDSGPAPWLTVLRQPLSTVQTVVGILAGMLTIGGGFLSFSGFSPPTAVAQQGEIIAVIQDVR